MKSSSGLYEERWMVFSPPFKGDNAEHVARWSWPKNSDMQIQFSFLTFRSNLNSSQICTALLSSPVFSGPNSNHRQSHNGRTHHSHTRAHFPRTTCIRRSRRTSRCRACPSRALGCHSCRRGTLRCYRCGRGRSTLTRLAIQASRYQKRRVLNLGAGEMDGCLA